MLLLLSLGAAADPLAALGFRPPAIPLLTTDPFTQMWVLGDNSTATDVVHWDSQPKETHGLVRVDGKSYTIFDLKAAERNGLPGVSRLPKSLKVLLEVEGPEPGVRLVHEKDPLPCREAEALLDAF